MAKKNQSRTRTILKRVVLFSIKGGKAMVKQYTQEEISKLESIAIEDYINQTQIGKIINNSSRWMKVSIAGHDSVVIDKRKNIFFHNGNIGEKNASGNIIKFVQYFEHKTSPEALATLSEDDYETIDNFREELPIEKEPFVYRVEDEVQTNDKAKDYLLHTRGISKAVVDYIFDKGYAAQNKYGAIVFKWFEQGDLSKPILGASIQGTVYDTKKYGKRGTFKQIVENSNCDNGFCITKGNANHVYFFESSIDLLSYWSLHPELDNMKLVAMEGLRDMAIRYHVLETVQNRLSDSLSFYLCVDNDEAGYKFSNYIESQFDKIDTNQNGYTIQYSNYLPEGYKDYNDKLLNKPLTDFVSHVDEVNEANNLKRFLIKEQGIHKDIVDTLLKRGIIKEDDMKRIIFYWRQDGKIVGGQTYSTDFSKSRFGRTGHSQSILQGSAPGALFSLNFGKQIDRLLVFQNPIDLLSFYTLYRHKLKEMSNGVRCICLTDVIQDEVHAVLKTIDSCMDSNIKHISLCFQSNQKSEILLDSISHIGKDPQERQQYARLFTPRVKVNKNIPKQTESWSEDLKLFLGLSEQTNEIEEQKVALASERKALVSSMPQRQKGMTREVKM